jgi:hypothetical protein
MMPCIVAGDALSEAGRRLGVAEDGDGEAAEGGPARVLLRPTLLVTTKVTAASLAAGPAIGVCLAQ